MQATRGLEVLRLAYCLAKSRGEPMGAITSARAMRWDRTVEVLELKATMTPLDRTSGGAGIVAFLDDLAAVLRDATIIGRLSQLRRHPANVRLLTATGGTSGAFVGEGEPAPASAMTVNADATLTPTKAVGLCAVSIELVERAVEGGDTLFARDILSGVIEAIDREFLALDAAPSAVRPGGIAYGASIFDLTAVSVAGMDDLIRDMAGTLTAAKCDLNTAAWIAHPRLAAWLATARNGDGGPAFPGVTLRGGQLHGLPMLTSTAAEAPASPTESTLHLIEQAQISIHQADADLGASQHAAVALDTGPGSPAQLVSGWQMGLITFRGSQFVAWKARRPGVACAARVNV